MIPNIRAELSAERSRDLLAGAAARRLARIAAGPRPGARQRLGLGLIAAGMRMVRPDEALNHTLARPQGW